MADMYENEALLDRVFRIYPAHSEGAYLEIQIDGDGMVTIQTTNEKSEHYFGKVSASFETEVAKKIAEALKELT